MPDTQAARAAELARLHREARLQGGSYLRRWLETALRPARLAPAHPLPPVGPDELAVTWIGHASMLLRYQSSRIACDPVLSTWAARVKRAIEPGLGAPELDVDLILISNAQGDHLDVATLARLPRRATVVTPPRVGELVAHLGFARVLELAHGTSMVHHGIQVTAEAVRHHVRGLRHRGSSCYLLEGDGPSALFVGASGYFSGFAEIGARFGPDVALLPIGGYLPGWLRAHHMSPLDALYAFEDLRSTALVPIHHSTFPLSSEPLDAPVAWLRDLAAERDLAHAVRVLEPGASIVFSRGPDKGVASGQRPE